MKASKRHKARRYLLQALYQWQMSGGESEDVTTISRQFVDGMQNDSADEAYFKRLFAAVVEEREHVDRHIQNGLDRDLSELMPVELAVLRLAVCELLRCPEISHRIIINEALELAKTYGSGEEAFKYVNAVLDKLAARVRSEGR